MAHERRQCAAFEAESFSSIGHGQITRLHDFRIHQPTRMGECSHPLRHCSSKISNRLDSGASVRRRGLVYKYFVPFLFIF
jgi:hypothetical protein